MLEPKNCSSNTSSSFITPVVSTYMRVAEVGDVQGGGVRRGEGVRVGEEYTCQAYKHRSKLHWHKAVMAAITFCSQTIQIAFVQLLKLTISDPRSFTINHALPEVDLVPSPVEKNRPQGAPQKFGLRDDAVCVHEQPLMILPRRNSSRRTRTTPFA